MTIGLTTSATSVTISGSVATTSALPFPNTTQTPIEFVGTDSAATVTAFTVPANKKYYITNIFIARTRGTGGCATFDLKRAGTKFFSVRFAGSSTVTNDTPNINPNVPLIFITGQTLTIDSNAGDGTNDYLILGYSIDV